MKSEANKTKATMPVGSGAVLGDFNPSLRNTSGNIWAASIRIPVVGDVTVTGLGWEEAKLKLWLVVKAVEMLAAQQCKEPCNFTDDEWRLTLETMHAIMSPNVES